MKHFWVIQRRKVYNDGNVDMFVDGQVSVKTEIGDGLDTILEQIMEGVENDSLEIAMIQDDDDE